MELLQQDIEILSRDYSIFRISNKWRSYRYSLKSCEISSIPENYIKIHRESLSVIDCYLPSSLLKRQEVKRSSPLLSEVQKLWLSLNPLNQRSISKQVYLVLIDLLYKQFQAAKANPALVPVCVAQDCEIDFKEKTCLTFAEFYDVLFEIIDALSKSTLANEYARLVFLNKINLLNSDAIKSINLCSKLHLEESSRISFHPWMQKSARFMSPEKRNEKLPEIFKALSNKELAPKFLSRVTVRVMKDNLPIRWDIQKLIQRKSSPGRSISPVLPAVKKSASTNRVDLKRKDPLSITPMKERKDTFLLEEVIEERSKKPFKKLF